MLARVETGVDGLDSILEGGLVENSVVLLSGNPGTGKSILGMQYLYSGVEDAGERGVYLSFEERADDISQAANSIGFERWDEYVEAGDIVVYDKRDLLSDDNFSDTLDKILDIVDDAAFQRLVLDSWTMFSMFFDDERSKRVYLLRFIDILKEHGLTSLLINEEGAIVPDAGNSLEHYLTDGNVYLIQEPTSSQNDRYLWVAKMRKQDFDNNVFPMEIGQGGVSVHDQASGFSLLSDSGFDFG